MSAPDWVLWGSHPSMCDGEPLKLMAGTVAECRRERRSRARLDDQWLLGTYRRADEPVGLRLEAAERAEAAGVVVSAWTQGDPRAALAVETVACATCGAVRPVERMIATTEVNCTPMPRALVCRVVEDCVDHTRAVLRRERLQRKALRGLAGSPRSTGDQVTR